MLVDLFLQHINFMIVSIVALFAYKNYILASKQPSKLKYIGIILFLTMLLTISIFFIVKGILRYQNFTMDSHLVPSLAVAFIFCMQLVLLNSTREKLRLTN